MSLVSQFWPDAPLTRWSFPMRNVVMSGMAAGTVCAHCLLQDE